jgi:hypothetical protein
MSLLPRRIALLAVGATLLALAPSAPAEAAAQNYGSIAFSPSNRVAVGAISDSRAGAARGAVAKCATQGGSGCFAVVWLKNSYGAFASAGNRSPNFPYGFAWAPTSRRAEQLALSYCGQDGGTDCKITPSASVHTQGPSTSGTGATFRPQLPFGNGQTWWVCQGYNGSISHRGIPALDLTVRKQDVGRDGCYGDTSASASQAVRSPGPGTAVLSGSDGICLNLDSGRSMWIGHLVDRASGPVEAGGVIGATEPPNSANGGYAHIHVQMNPGRGCAASGSPIPFDYSHGAIFIGAPNLPYAGTVNQYSGLGLSRR